MEDGQAGMVCPDKKGGLDLSVLIRDDGVELISTSWLVLVMADGSKAVVAPVPYEVIGLTANQSDPKRMAPYLDAVPRQCLTRFPVAANNESSQTIERLKLTILGAVEMLRGLEAGIFSATWEKGLPFIWSEPDSPRARARREHHFRLIKPRHKEEVAQAISWAMRVKRDVEESL